MRNPKVGKVKTGKQIINHVTAPMSGQFSKSRSSLLRNCPNAFYNFTMGNRPKMSLKYAIQESIPPFLGIVGDKKWSPFLDLGIRSPIFLHLKTAIFSNFGCNKWDFGCPNPKWRPLFVANYPQKCWNRLLFHKNIIFGRVLGKF